MPTITVSTRTRTEMVDITPQVREAVAASGLRRGAVLVYVPHTTAGCTINENADPDVPHDILLMLDELVPRSHPRFRHAEGNSDAHIKASMMGFGQWVPVENGELALGTWQGVFLAEFDGPRQRQVIVQPMPVA